jgi:hypothetical protein
MVAICDCVAVQASPETGKSVPLAKALRSAATRHPPPATQSRQTAPPAKNFAENYSSSVSVHILKINRFRMLRNPARIICLYGFLNESI